MNAGLSPSRDSRCIGHQSRIRQPTVARVETLAPRMRRVVFAGEALGTAVSHEAAED